MEAFPKSHIVTFEYYVGLIHFLDENYSEVRTPAQPHPPRVRGEDDAYSWAG